MKRAVVWVAAMLALGACFERGSSKVKAKDDAATAAPVPPKLVDTGGEPTGSADPNAEVVVWLEAEPAHLNPMFADALAIRIAHGDVFEGLLCRREAGKPPVACLAETVDASADGKRWTFALRKGVTWHDGAPFTAKDVVFTYGLLTGKNKAPSVFAADFDDLEQLEAVDEHTVTMVFSGFRVGREDSFANVPVLAAHAFAGVAPHKVPQAEGSRNPIGTGPFRFAGWKQGAARLERFDGYWGEPAKVRAVIHKRIDSRTAAVEMLSAGSIDVILQLPVDEAKAASANARLFTYETQAYLAAVWNVRRPALTDPEVRRALGMLLDRRGILEQVFKGYAQPIAGPFPARSIEVPISANYAAAKRKAKVLLHKAGAKPAVKLLVPSGSRTMERIADIWASDAAGLAELTVEQAPFGEVLERARRGDFDAVLLAFTTGDDFDHYDRFHSSQIGKQNYGGLKDEALDRLLEQVRKTPDRAERRAIEGAIERRLGELQPSCFMVSDQRVGLARSRIGGVVVTRDGLSARSLWVQK